MSILWRTAWGSTKSYTGNGEQAMPKTHRIRGFTLIELLVVMAIIATLLSLVTPRYFHSVDKAKESVLKENLFQVRDAIDKYYGDKGKYPDSLEELIEKKYLRKMPLDPVTDRTDTWVIVPPVDRVQGNLYDVKSGAPGTAADGSLYAEW